MIRGPVQSRDGQSHFTYFDYATQTSFVWDGKSDHIEVSVGGYGEPVVEHYVPYNVGMDRPIDAGDWLDWFTAVCLAYLIAKHTGARKESP
jgi:hypothetical protein